MMDMPIKATPTRTTKMTTIKGTTINMMGTMTSSMAVKAIMMKRKLQHKTNSRLNNIQPLTLLLAVITTRGNIKMVATMTTSNKVIMMNTTTTNTMIKVLLASMTMAADVVTMIRRRLAISR